MTLYKPYNLCSFSYFKTSHYSCKSISQVNNIFDQPNGFESQNRKVNLQKVDTLNRRSRLHSENQTFKNSGDLLNGTSRPGL